MKFWRSKSQASNTIRERRLDIRKPTYISALVCSEQSGATPCVISSLSLTGMFLELEEEVDFETGALLQLVFYSTMDSISKRCGEWVHVAGMRKNGVAVSYAHFDNEHQTNILFMLHQATIYSVAPLTVNANRHGTNTTDHNRKTA